MSEPLPAALDGLCVLDLSRDLAGPLVGQTLGDLGARVVKVEGPHHEDETRGWGPPFIGGLSAYFAAFNCNKQGLSLDLKHPAARAVLADLVRRADVVVENFRAETAARLGLAPETVQALNPRAIHLSVSAYGRTGSGTDRPGYDLLMQAGAGLMSITGEPDGPPIRYGIPIVDILTGVYGAVAVLAALQVRARTGRGQWIDLALHDVAIAALANVGSAHLNTGQPARRFGNAHPTLVPYQAFGTRDGALVIAVGNDEQWRRLCGVLGRADLAADARFATNARRVEHRAALVPELEAAFARETTAHWERALLAAGVPAGPIRSVAEALAEPLVAERGLLWEALAGETPVRVVGSPLAHLTDTPARLSAPPPAHGADTARVLGDLLGYSPERIQALRDAGAI